MILKVLNSIIPLAREITTSPVSTSNGKPAIKRTMSSVLDVKNQVTFRKIAQEPKAEETIKRVDKEHKVRCRKVTHLPAIIVGSKDIMRTYASNPSRASEEAINMLLLKIAHCFVIVAKQLGILQRIARRLNREATRIRNSIDPTLQLTRPIATSATGQDISRRTAPKTNLGLHPTTNLRRERNHVTYVEL